MRIFLHSATYIVSLIDDGKPMSTGAFLSLAISPVKTNLWRHSFCMVLLRRWPHTSVLSNMRTVTKMGIPIFEYIPYIYVYHHSDVVMGATASQITSLTIVYSTVYSGADQNKYQSSASLAIVRGIHRWLVNSLHKWPVTRRMFPFEDVIMMVYLLNYDSQIASGIQYFSFLSFWETKGKRETKIRIIIKHIVWIVRGIEYKGFYVYVISDIKQDTHLEINEIGHITHSIFRYHPYGKALNIYYINEIYCVQCLTKINPTLSNIFYVI